MAYYYVLGFNDKDHLHPPQCLEAVKELFEKIIDLGPNVTEAAILSMSEYHQVKKRKDITFSIAHGLSTKFKFLGFEQQAKCWSKRIKKDSLKPGNLKLLETEKTDPKAEIENGSGSKMVRLMNYLSKQNDRQYLSSKGYDIIQAFSREDLWELRISMALPMISAQLKLGQYHEIINKTFPKISTWFWLNRSDEFDLNKVHDDLVRTMKSCKTENEREKVSMFFFKMAFMTCLKGAAYLGINEAKSGREYILAGNVISTLGQTIWNQLENPSNHLKLLSFCIICECYRRELYPHNANLEGFPEEHSNTYFIISSKMLEETPVPFYMVFRLFDELRKTIPSEENQEKVLVHMNSIAVRSHFSLNSTLEKLQ